jgi:hypothetical protein
MPREAIASDSERPVTSAEVRAVARPMFKVHYTRPGIARGRASVYVYGPKTEPTARRIALSRLPEDSSILFVETLTLEATRLSLQ